MKKIYIFIVAIIAIIKGFSQQQVQLNVVWKISTDAPYSVGSDEVNNNFALLPDQSVVYYSSKFNPSNLTVSIALSKINSAGVKLINNIQLQGPYSYPAQLSKPTIFLKSTIDGKLAFLFGNLLSKFDENLNLLWSKQIRGSVNNPTGISTQLIDMNILSNNNFLFTYNTFTGTAPRTVPAGSLLYGLNPVGDSLFLTDAPGSNNIITKPGPVGSFLTAEPANFTQGISLKKRNTSNASIVNSISLPTNNLVSNYGYFSFKGYYASLISPAQNPFPASNNYSLEVLDSNLNQKASLLYNNIVYPLATLNINLEEDRKSGFYYYQYKAQVPPMQEYITLGRLDSTGNVVWSIKIDNPAIGIISKLIPLAGNDFLLVAGGSIFYITSTFPSLNRNLTFGPSTTIKGSSLFRAEDAKTVQVTDFPGFTVKVLENPSLGNFKIILKGTNNTSISLIITDVLGRIIESKQHLTINTILQFGANYGRGTYFAKITQSGQLIKTVKLIKK